jgi:hypothetical protein
MTYPGQVKVTVIRETRAVNIANNLIVLGGMTHLCESYRDFFYPHNDN